MKPACHRRSFLRAAGASMLAPALVPPLRARGADAPTAPVAIARCRTYDPAPLLETLATMMDQIGGLQTLVAGKTVVVKANVTGHPREQALGLPAGQTYQTHPSVVLAVATLLDKAGARRIRFVEGTYQTGPIEPHLQSAGWDLQALSSLKALVDYEDTRNLGKGSKYHEVKVPWGGYLFPAYHLNHSFVDCDVYVSIAKLKNHAAAGVTLGMKNNFGVVPPALYGQSEEVPDPTSNRVPVIHMGEIPPAPGVPKELPDTGPRRMTNRVPRHTVDAAGIRPIDLTIIDGIETVAGGEGPWHKSLVRQTPGLLLAGRNVVCTDAVATSVMGYDPRAPHGTGVFPGLNHLTLAAEAGLGTHDLDQIQVVGLPISQARHPFQWLPKERNI